MLFSLTFYQVSADFIRLATRKKQEKSKKQEALFSISTLMRTILLNLPHNSCLCDD